MLFAHWTLVAPHFCARLRECAPPWCTPLHCMSRETATVSCRKRRATDGSTTGRRVLLQMPCRRIVVLAIGQGSGRAHIGLIPASGLLAGQHPLPDDEFD